MVAWADGERLLRQNFLADECSKGLFITGNDFAVVRIEKTQLDRIVPVRFDALDRRGLELVAAARCPMDMPNDDRRAAAWIFETRLQYRPLRRRSLYLRDEPVIGLGQSVIQDEAAANNIDVGFILGLLITTREKQCHHGNNAKWADDEDDFQD